MEKVQLSQLITKQNEILTAIHGLINNNQNDYSTFFQTCVGGIVSAFVGAILAYYFSTRHFKEDIKHRRKIDQIARLREALDKFETICNDYWSQDFDNESDANMTSKIVLSHRKLRRLAKEYVKLPDVAKKEGEKINSFVGDLYDEATGGAFSSPVRTASKRKQRLISRGCEDILCHVDY